MKKTNLNEIAKLEKAIKEKFGPDAIINPKSSWNKEKEDKYLETLREFYRKRERVEEVETLEGFTLKNKRSKKQKVQNRLCPICENYSFSIDDDLYMNKFECCFNCYIKYVEDREQRWKSGWRPNN